MSRQLALSSLFSVLAMASLCVVATTRENAFRVAAGPAGVIDMQAELAPGLPI